MSDWRKNWTKGDFKPGLLRHSSGWEYFIAKNGAGIVKAPPPKWDKFDEPIFQSFTKSEEGDLHEQAMILSKEWDWVGEPMPVQILTGTAGNMDFNLKYPNSIVAKGSQLSWQCQGCKIYLDMDVPYSHSEETGKRCIPCTNLIPGCEYS